MSASSREPVDLDELHARSKRRKALFTAGFVLGVVALLVLRARREGDPLPPEPREPIAMLVQGLPDPNPEGLLRGELLWRRPGPPGDTVEVRRTLKSNRRFRVSTALLAEAKPPPPSDAALLPILTRGLELPDKAELCKGTTRLVLVPAAGKPRWLALATGQCRGALAVVSPTGNGGVEPSLTYALGELEGLELRRFEPLPGYLLVVRQGYERGEAVEGTEMRILTIPDATEGKEARVRVVFTEDVAKVDRSGLGVDRMAATIQLIEKRSGALEIQRRSTWYSSPPGGEERVERPETAEVWRWQAQERRFAPVTLN